MKIEILHPIHHDEVEYPRGIQEVPDSIGATLLKYPWAARAVPEQETTPVEISEI